MKTCIVLISHSFRINSRIFKKAMTDYSNFIVVYSSPWYWSKSEKNVLSKGDSSFHFLTINHFSYELKDRYSSELYIIKEENPIPKIKQLFLETKADKILYDMPLFGKSSWLDLSDLPHEVIDSDTHDPQCEKMTAKSRWVYWSKNRIGCSTLPDLNDELLKISLNNHKPNKEKYLELNLEIKKDLSRFSSLILDYGKQRNSRQGSSRLSKYLHHGLIDANELTSKILSLVPGFIEKTNPLVPFLRQLAFREICIRKARVRDLSMNNTVEVWIEKSIDKKSVDNLKKEFDQKYTIKQMMTGTTGDEMLDFEIKLAIKERWMANRARMWLSGEFYYCLGGGLKSVEALIDFFNSFIEDGQSPNNYICCAEAMRLQYGKVMRYNRERTNKLLNEVF